MQLVSQLVAIGQKRGMTATVGKAEREGAVERASAYAPFLRNAVEAFPDIVSIFADRGSDAAVEAALSLEGEAVAERLATRVGNRADADRLAVVVTSRCIAAAVFGAMELWMNGEDCALPELAQLCQAALGSLEHGMVDGMFRHY